MQLYELPHYIFDLPRGSNNTYCNSAVERSTTNFTIDIDANCANPDHRRIGTFSEAGGRTDDHSLDDIRANI